MTTRRALGALSIAVLASGCMTLAPPYPASTANATSAAALGAPVALGTPVSRSRSWTGQTSTAGS